MISFAFQTDELDTIILHCLRQEFIAVTSNLLCHKAFDLLLEVSILVYRFADSTSEVRSVIEHTTQTIYHIHLLVVEFVRFLCRYRLNTTNTRSHTSLHHDAQCANLSCRSHVATTTEFYRWTEFNHAHIVAIFLAKECHSAHRFCFLNWCMTALLERQVLTDNLIG